jgi:threonine/homoserine/homoserine lactone efflux protein
MRDAAFWPALWIGLSIAAPVGPIGVLVIQRTLVGGRALGLATGWGAAVADAAYGALGAFGVAALIGWLQGLRMPLVLGGAAFLLWLAWRTWQSADAAAALAAADVGPVPGLLAAFAGTLLLTLSNPATILSFVAIFGSMAAQQQRAGSPGVMVAGVLAGSALWWLGLVAVVGALRQRIDGRARQWVGRMSALMLAAFAVWQLLGLLAT